MPHICKLNPSGKYHIQQLYAAGGMDGVLKTLLDGGLIHENCINVTGVTLKERLADAVVTDRDVIHTLDTAYSATGGIAILSGNLAPDGAVVKQAGSKTGNVSA